MVLFNFYPYLSITIFIFYVVSLLLYVKKINKEEYSEKREIILISSLIIFVLIILYLELVNLTIKKNELNKEIKENGTLIKVDIMIFQHKKYIKNKFGDYVLIENQ